MILTDKQQKIIDTIVGLHNKIQDIKKQQIYIKAFETDISNCLKNLFPNLSNSLINNKEGWEWPIEIFECNSKEEVLQIIHRMQVCEEEILNEKNHSNYKDETPNPIGDEQLVLHKQIELLKDRFDDIVVYLKDLEKEIIRLEKKSVNSLIKDHYE